MNKFKKTVEWTLRTLGLVCICLVIVSGVIGATEPSTQSGSTLVMVTIEPSRYIVVNDSFQITEIASNTTQNVVPLVVINSLDGSYVPYTSGIESQYQSLKRSINFNHAGIVYTRPVSTSIGKAFINALVWIKNVIFG